MKLELVLQKLGLIQPGKIMYIGGSDVLPAPLRPEDERRAIEALAASDETARQTLIEHNLRRQRAALVGRAGHGRGYRHAPAGGRRGPSAAAAGTRPAAGAGETDRLHALRPRRAAGEDAEGGCGSSGDFPVIYFQTGKKDYEEAEKRNREI